MGPDVIHSYVDLKTQAVSLKRRLLTADFRGV